MLVDSLNQRPLPVGCCPQLISTCRLTHPFILTPEFYVSTLTIAKTLSKGKPKI